MSSVDYEAARRALRTVLVAVTDFPPEARREWENRTFQQPKDGAIWVRELMNPQLTHLQGHQNIEGIAIYQIEVCKRAGEGTEGMGTLAAAIADAFHPGQSIGGYAIDRAEQLSGFKDDDINAYVIPVQITFRAYATISS